MLEINILQRDCNVISTYFQLPGRRSQLIQVIVRMHQYNQNKTIRTDQRFSVSMVVIATVAILTIGSISTNMAMAHHEHHESGSSSSGSSNDPQSVTCGIGETFSQTDQRCEISGTGLLNACLDHIGICSAIGHALLG
ncbi:MAG: hypothetical protein WBE34_06135 [Candidatus Nitrosopolaris sp.]